MKTALFWADEDEFNAGPLIECADWIGLKHVQVGPQTVRRAQISSTHSRSTGSHSIDTGEASFSLREIGACWSRGAALLRPPNPGAAENLAFFEWRYLVEYLFSELSNVYWMNHPNAIERAGNRLQQLRRAEDFGFRTPRTLVTNDPGEAKNFLRECERVIVKQICDGHRRQIADRLLYTVLITAGEADCLDQVQVCPTLIQQYVEKDHELRVTVVGDQVFAAAIESQADAQCAVDSRLTFGTDITYYRTRLNEAISTRLGEMLRSYGLEYGAFDFVVDPSGDLVFLEVNPSGQWDAIEHATGFPILESIVRRLAYACSL